MLIIPAIDLIEGEVVRLKEGKKDTRKVYSLNPVDTAKTFSAQGAELIHVIDLDAAFDQGDNFEVIKNIINAGFNLQVGGGIRSLDRASRLIDMGVKRIIIGSKATDENFLTVLVKAFGERLAVSVDVLEGKFMKSGWQQESGYEFLDFVEYLIGKGVEWIIYTDISRDGTLAGVDLEGIRKLNDIKGANFIVSGGVSSLDDILTINKQFPFIKGVITGKAIYEGYIDLEKAINSLKQ